MSIIECEVVPSVRVHDTASVRFPLASKTQGCGAASLLTTRLGLPASTRGKTYSNASPLRAGRPRRR